MFSDLDLRDCCENTEFAANFRTGKNGTDAGYYYLNNFDNVMISYVTLFQLMSGNSWEVTMEGYVILSSPWSRIYFISFYLVTMVVSASCPKLHRSILQNFRSQTGDDDRGCVCFGSISVSNPIQKQTGIYRT